MPVGGNLTLVRQTQTACLDKFKLKREIGLVPVVTRYNNGKYTTTLCDGDSRTFHAIKHAKVSDFVDAEREHCINHIQKRKGTALQNLVQKHKSKGMHGPGGKGRFTADLNRLNALLHG